MQGHHSRSLSILGRGLASSDIELGNGGVSCDWIGQSENAMTTERNPPTRKNHAKL